jgi:hypothetical protein
MAVPTQACVVVATDGTIPQVQRPGPIYEAVGPTVDRVPLPPTLSTGKWMLLATWSQQTYTSVYDHSR